MTLYRRATARTALALGLIATGASAQYTALDYNVQYNQAYSYMQVNNMIMNQHITAMNMAGDNWKRATNTPDRDGKGSKGSTTRADAGAASGNTDFSYRPDAAVSRQMEAAFIERMSKVDPAMTGLLKDEFRKQSALSRFEDDVTPYGLSSHDIGDSMTAYWVVMWITANQKGLPTRPQVQAVRAQVGRQLAGNATIVKADGRTRQQISELYIYEMLLMLSARNGARTAAEKQQAADKAWDVMHQQGLDFRKLRLTDTGFVAAG